MNSTKRIFSFFLAILGQTSIIATSANAQVIGPETGPPTTVIEYYGAYTRSIYLNVCSPEYIQYNPYNYPIKCTKVNLVNRRLDNLNRSNQGRTRTVIDNNHLGQGKQALAVFYVEAIDGRRCKLTSKLIEGGKFYQLDVARYPCSTPQ